MTKENTFHWIVKSFIYIVRDISSNNEIFQKGYTFSYQMEIRICTNWYFLQYNLQSYCQKIADTVIDESFIYEFGYSQIFSIIDNPSTIFRRTACEIQLPFNSTFSSSHYCFFIPMEGKKKLIKNTKKKWILSKI